MVHQGVLGILRRPFHIASRIAIPIFCDSVSRTIIHFNVENVLTDENFCMTRIPSFIALFVCESWISVEIVSRRFRRVGGPGGDGREFPPPRREFPAQGGAVFLLAADLSLRPHVFSEQLLGWRTRSTADANRTKKRDRGGLLNRT